MRPVTMFRRLSAAGILSMALCLGFTAGCGGGNPVGRIVAKADLVYLSPERLEGDEGIGIVYRQVMDFDAFLAQSDLPVLILVTERAGYLDQPATLLLEQLAYAYRGRMACLRVEEGAYPDVESFCGAGTVPCFALTDKGAMLRTTGGLDNVDENQIIAMLSSSGVS